MKTIELNHNQLPILSKYRGVTFCKKAKKFRVIIRLSGKQKHIGLYSDEITAAKARDIAVKMLSGDNVRLNFYDDNLNENDKDYKLIRLDKGMFAKVDPEDFERANKLTWFAHEKSNCPGKYYAETGCNENGKRQSLHTFIMGAAPDGFVWDHENRDPLDDRRKNLRLATNQQNCFNNTIQSNKAVPFKGVDLVRYNNKVRARIKFNNKEIYLGMFSTPIEGALAYDRAAVKHFKEFANLNLYNLNPNDFLSYGNLLMKGVNV